jgi:hypothetical protein
MIQEQIETLDTTRLIRESWRRSRRRQRAVAACGWAIVVLGLCWLVLIALGSLAAPA